MTEVHGLDVCPLFQGYGFNGGRSWWDQLFGSKPNDAANDTDSGSKAGQVETEVQAIADCSRKGIA